MASNKKEVQMISKNIITPDGEDEFQIRYIHDENVGVVTTHSDKSYFILDSIDYWYDSIQKRYPAKQKCHCKNDFFTLYFNYIPRIGTDDYRAVQLISCCTECGKERKFAEIDIDYSPTAQLYEYPITYCRQPKIKYKVYSLKGFWTDDAFHALINFLSEKQLLIYCWYWEDGKNGKRRCVNHLSAEELEKFLFEEKLNYLCIYFSMEPLETLFDKMSSMDNGIYVDRDIWRKRQIIQVNSPIMVAAKGAGYFYSIDFCSEYIEADEVKAKPESFSRLVCELLEYSKGR